MVIHLAKSDITEMAVDAVVTPTNSLGIMGGGVAAALHRKGGPAIQREAMSLAPIAVGAAVVTNAGTLWAKHVIHAPTMEEPGTKIGIENVRRATRAALIAAAHHGFEIIALPGMGTGLGGVDPADAARAIVDELRAHRQPKPATVYLVDVNDQILLCLEEALRSAAG
jgi:O-acetyl-ADP-ribose deacetylase (regulator of RNase III)